MGISRETYEHIQEASRKTLVTLEKQVAENVIFPKGKQTGTLEYKRSDGKACSEI
ncbi:hypothetical protein VCHA38O209_80152 [Vibrio chagasii]|nr:hypothetical protein VCHA38O209_80152 [Vibrio chagasii]